MTIYDKIYHIIIDVHYGKKYMYLDFQNNTKCKNIESKEL